MILNCQLLLHISLLIILNYIAYKDLEMSSPNVEVRRKRKKQIVGRVIRVVHHTWTHQKDAVLVQYLHIMTDDLNWKGKMVPLDQGTSIN